MSNKEVFVNLEHVGSSFDDFLKEEVSEEESKIIDAKMQFLQELIDLRKNNHLTQVELEKKTGIKQSTIAKIENGGINPSLNNLFRLLGAMGKTIKITPL